MRAPLTVAFSVIVLFGAISFAQELPFSHYTPEKELNPLPSSAVMMTHQDRLGYIWFVVYSSGLARYNGARMELFTVDDGLPSLDVRQILEDDEGRLWVATEAGIAVSTKGLHEYELSERISFTSTIDELTLYQQFVHENRFCLGPSGTIWVGTRAEGIIRYNIGANRYSDTVSTSVKEGRENLEVRSIIKRRDGTVWASLIGGQLVRYGDDGSLIGVLTSEHGLPANESDALFESSSGILYGGSVDGVIWMLSGSPESPGVSIIRSPITSRITHITETSEGAIWVSSEQSGVVKLPDGAGLHPIHYSVRNGLLSDLVWNVMEDRERNIWISQIGGVSKLRLDYLAFLSYTAATPGGLPPYLEDPGVNSVLPPRKGSAFSGIWAATSGGGATFIGDNGVIHHLGTSDGLESDWVHSLDLDNSGRLWIGTSSGLSSLVLSSGPAAPPGDGSRIVFLPQGKATLTRHGTGNSTIYSSAPFSLKEEVSGGTVPSIWFTAYRAVYAFAGDRWYTFRENSGLPETYFTSIVLDPSGVLWVGTRDAGLYRSTQPITNKTLISFQIKQNTGEGVLGREVSEAVFELAWNESRGSPSNQIESLVFHDGILWVGHPNGLDAFDPEGDNSVAHLSIKDGLPGADVTSLAFAPQTATLWLGTNGGLAEVDPEKREVARTLKKKDGLLDNEVWWYGSVRVGEDGKIYFGTAKGLALFDPSQEKKNEIEPIVRFEVIREQSDLSTNSISLRFSALSFADERQVLYRTLLEGYEDEWSDKTDEAIMRYTNLPAFFVPSEYTAKVQARNNDGVWTSEPIAYAFAVQPPWWLRWWFALIVLVVLVGFSYTFLHFRTLQLQKRSRDLEITVQERTAEIREQSDHIQKQADELSNKNVELEEKNAQIIRTQEQLIVSEKLASLGSLTAGIAHEIKNPLNFVNNFSEVSVEIAQELKEDLAALKERLDEETFKRLEYSALDLEENATKINEHGKRADGIVKGMLEHSRGQTGVRESADVNAMLDEYINLAFHGLKAQEPECEVVFEKNYDDSIGKIEVFPQDLSRVFLNVVNNACYAVNKKRKAEGPAFSPLVRVNTSATADQVVISVRDNGPGMPKDVLEKVFNPFFTTKPTGEGTGLGLSLSHDIVVKQHGGKIEVKSEEGKWTEFRIILPMSTGGG